MEKEGVSVILLLHKNELRFLDALVKISRKENNRHLNICLPINHGDAIDELEKMRSIISLNHLLTLNVYLCPESEISKILKKDKIYVVYSKDDSERAMQLVHALTVEKTSVEEVIIDEL